MAFFIAEGYYYTRDVKKYMKRLLIFAVISYIPYIYYRCGHIFPIELIKSTIIPAVFQRPNLALYTEPSIYLHSLNSVLVIHENKYYFYIVFRFNKHIPLGQSQHIQMDKSINNTWNSILSSICKLPLHYCIIMFNTTS